MKRLAVVALLLLEACAENMDSNKPGGSQDEFPTAGGWLVQIGSDPSPNPDPNTKCMAVVIASNIMNDRTQWPESKDFVPTKTLGPFDTRGHAKNALIKAGWATFTGRVGVWYAKSGC